MEWKERKEGQSENKYEGTKDNVQNERAYSGEYLDGTLTSAFAVCILL